MQLRKQTLDNIKDEQLTKVREMINI